MPQEERDALIQSVFQKINETKQTEEGNESEVTNANAQANLEKGSAFLALNSKAPGVKTLASGLQYKVLSTGDAKSASPKTTSNVTVNYEGKLIDGTIFDSSYERGTPASFPVNGVIKGWTEILQLMHKGDIWEVYIPSDLAYGANGAGGKIGPNETLIFKVELLEIN